MSHRSSLNTKGTPDRVSKQQDVLAFDSQPVAHILYHRLTIAHAPVSLQRHISTDELSEAGVAEKREPRTLVHAAIVEKHHINAVVDIVTHRAWIEKLPRLSIAWEADECRPILALTRLACNSALEVDKREKDAVGGRDSDRYSIAMSLQVDTKLVALALLSTLHSS
jgi:hypothetical protein